MAIGSIADILIQWENIGFFEYLLPFLLIFAVVFGILSYMKIFGDNRAVHAILAVVLGLLAIRAEFFRAFLGEIAPRLGVGLTILLAALILVGLFIQDQSKRVMGWILIGIAAVIFIIMMGQMQAVFQDWGGGISFSDTETISWIIMLGLLITMIVIVAIGSSSKSTSPHNGKFVPLYDSR